MDHIIKIVKLLEDSGMIIDDTTQVVKHEIKKQEIWFLGAMMAPMATSLIIPMAFSLTQPMASHWYMLYLENETWEQEKDKKVHFIRY